jgi:hypothetical protein
MAIGVVANADPVDVLPDYLSRSFVRAAGFSILSNEYREGESQRSLLGATERLSWDLAESLTAAQLTALRTFYEAHDGPTVPFYFVEPYDALPYVVRFDMPWGQQIQRGRLGGSVQMRLIQLA